MEASPGIEPGLRSYKTLHPYVTKKKSNPERDIKMQPYSEGCKVFTEKQERDLDNNINTLTKMCNSLSRTALQLSKWTRNMALKLQHHGNHLDVLGWNGREAFYNAVIIAIIRTPEACNLSR
jgi:hypothetical protein